MQDMGIHMTTVLYWIGKQYDMICFLKSNSSHSPEGALDGRRYITQASNSEDAVGK